LNRLGAPAPLALGAATSIGVAAAAAYGRFELARSFATALSPAVLVFPALFVFWTPVVKLAFPAAPAELASARGAPDTPVVFLLFDLLPVTSLMTAEREIDAERFPAFARLAGDAYWFRYATTVAPNTSRSVPAILTGLRPVPGAQPLVSDYPANLFSLLAPSHELSVFETETRLCPAAVCSRAGESGLAERLRGLASDGSIAYLHLVLPESMRAGVPPITSQWHDFAAPAPVHAAQQREQSRLRQDGLFERRSGRMQKFMRFRASLRADRGAFLSYLHLPLPHSPFVYMPSGRSYVPVGPIGRMGPMGREMRRLRGQRSSGWADSAEKVRLAYQRVTLQIGFADKLLGGVLDRLRALGLYDRSLIVVVADHGMSFIEGGQRRMETDGNTIYVPLFVKLPGQEEGVVDDRNAETIDILPTIADALGMALPWRVDGQSLLQPDRGERRLKRVSPARRSGLDSATVELEDWRLLLEESLARKLRLTGAGPMQTLFRTGPRGELFGHGVAELREGLDVGGQRVQIVPGVAGRVEIDQRRLLDRVDLGSFFIPAYLTGKFHPAEDTGVSHELVVAVNGVVAGTTYARKGDAAAGFALMLPESAFEDGENRIDVFVASAVALDEVHLVPAQVARR
ncbi:MAG: sulfatase-like hydrolase/transferase, partial [Deltaproteobacteria bacterium]|nr:sulfatase-like hydrolase/transferase [Deltaproteobacteria bacterium]